MVTTTQNKPILLLEAPNDHSSPAFVESILSVNAGALAIGLDVFHESRDRLAQRVPIEEHEELKDRPVIVYGSIQFVRDIKSPIIPGAYGYHGTDWQTMSSYLPRSWLLNSDYMMTTFADLAHDFEWWTNIVDPVGLFIRPNSDKKAFPAQVVPKQFWREEISYMKQLSAIPDETLCVVSGIKTVGDEFRFWIVDRQVVGESHYRNTRDLFKRTSSVATPQAARDLAADVARMEWQPDACYVVDICCRPEYEPAIVEMNSFCSAGVYNSDTARILQAVVDQSIRDYYP